MTPNPNFGAAAGSTDIDLVADTRATDAAPFVGLFDRHAETLYHYALALTGDHQEAIRVVRRLFTIAWLKRRSMRFAHTSALPWLLANCRRLAIGSTPFHRRRPGSGSATEGEFSAVFVAVGELSALEQQLCWLCVHEALPYRAAALQLRVTTFTAQGRREYADELGDEYSNDRSPSTDYREAMS